ncbi:MAG: hypothetical protein WDN72_01870 [Alphaproteobacteria bacterium]
MRHATLLVLEDAHGRLYLESRRDALLGGLYGFPAGARRTVIPRAGGNLPIRSRNHRKRFPPSRE